jgi:glycosyltransferase involved in cell wall biosynthesis
MKHTKTNLLFVTNGLGVGGSEKLLVDLVNHLDLEKFDLTIASLKADLTLAPTIQPGRAELIVFPRGWRYDLSPALRLRKLIQEKQIDVIVPFAMYDYFFSRVATSFWSGYPQTDIYIHSYEPPTRKWFIQDWVYTRLLRKAERFVSVCNAQAAYWSGLYGIPLDKFTTIHNGVDSVRFDPARAESNARDIRRELSLPSDARIILLVASLWEYKRHDDALLALQHGRSRLPQNTFLLLVGGGTAERVTFLKRRAQSLGIAERVVFCGKQNDVRPFLRAADIFTLTSDSETFSIAALEAMAMGVPCVLTDIGGAREMVTDGGNGFLVKAGDPESIADGWAKALAGRHSLSSGAIRARVMNEFSLTHMLAQFEGLLGAQAKQ